MKNSIQAIRERRAAVVTAMQTMLAENENSWSAEHASKWDAMDADVVAMDRQIAAHTRTMELDAQASGADIDALRDQHTRTPGAHGDKGEAKALRAFLRSGLSGVQAEAPDLFAAMRARQTGEIRAAMSTTTTTEGGYTTAPEYIQSLLAAMKAYGGVRAVARIINTATGNEMLWPTADATAEEGEIVGQNSPVAGLDTTFGQVSMSVYKYSSKKIALPFELIQDSFIDIEAYIRDVLAMRLGRITAKHYATGTGTGQPRGLMDAIATGKTTASSPTAFDYDDLVDLEHSVDPVYRGRAGVGYMMHDNTVAVIRKLKDDQKRPIFVPGYEQGNPGGAPDRLMGRPLYICQEMASSVIATSKPIAFGDFSAYLIRDVMDLTLFRMTDSAFTLNGQVGFVAFMRSGGNLIDVGGAVKCLTMHA